MKNARLRIEGMSCAACVRSVENVLDGAEGTAGCTVDLAAGSAEVRFDPQHTSAAVLAGLLTENGFDTAVIDSD